MTERKTFSHSGAAVFHTTRWTMVMRSKGEAPEARAALGDLCEAYWMPVYRFLRREGRSDDASRELAQEFFARLLARGGIEGADPEKGRFRSYLLGALKHFLADQRRGEGRQKRGGGVEVESIESGITETSPGWEIPDPTATISDTYFDREWALAIMDRALNAVQAAFEESGKGRQYQCLKPWLMGDSENLSQSDAGAELGMTTGAIKVAIHRLRKEFRTAIQAEIAQTVNTPEEIATELRYLIEVLS
jgi:RNA polymerase sigma-70 factor (ECF subfamily)